MPNAAAEHPDANLKTIGCTRPPRQGASGRGMALKRGMAAVRRLWRSMRLEHDLGPSRLASIELPICLRGFVERQLVRDEEGGFCPPLVNEFAEVAVIGLYGRLPSAHPKAS